MEKSTFTFPIGLCIFHSSKKAKIKTRFSRRKNLEKCASFEEQKVTRYFPENVYFDIIVFSCLSSTKPCLRFLLICFGREKKGFYQISWGNEVDFTNMKVSPKIPAQTQNFKKLRHGFLDEKQWLQRHSYLPVTGKPFYLFACKRKDLKTHF